MGFYPYIAIGHGRTTDGNWDCGCTWNGYDEASMAKEVVAGIIEAFDANGKDYLTDYPDNESNITNCVAAANNNGCTHYLSIHLDYDRAPSGILPLYVSDAGYAMADCIRAALKARIAINDRGNKYQADYECTGTDMPAVILDCIRAALKARIAINDRGNKYQADYECTGTDVPAVIFEIGSICADNEFIRTNAALLGNCLAYGMMDFAGESYKEINGSMQPDKPTQVDNDNPYGFTTIYNDDYYLSYGDGPDENIRQFQADCTFCAYFGENGPLDQDCYYGSEGAYACECIQRFHGLEVDGKFGANTDIALMTEIAQIQEALKRKGYDIAIDGGAGPATLAALKDFQNKNGLEVDGICGNATRAALGI